MLYSRELSLSSNHENNQIERKGAVKMDMYFDFLEHVKTTSIGSRRIVCC